jgi:hypothetical protein
MENRCVWFMVLSLKVSCVAKGGQKTNKPHILIYSFLNLLAYIEDIYYFDPLQHGHHSYVSSISFLYAFNFSCLIWAIKFYLYHCISTGSILVLLVSLKPSQLPR